MDYPDLLGQLKEEAVFQLTSMGVPYELQTANDRAKSLSGEQRVIRQLIEKDGKTVLLIAYF